MIALLVLASCSDPPSNQDTVEQPAEVASLSACNYTQAFGNGTHTGIACPEVNGLKVVARLTQDPDADAENAFSGFLQIHEPPPLTSGDYVVVPGKTGYVDSFDRSTETYSTTVYRWSPNVFAANAELVQVWSNKTSWQPVDAIFGSFGAYTNGYVQQFAPAIVGNSLYVPARFGRLSRMNLKTGALVATINPLAGTSFDGDELTIVTNAVSSDRFNNVYYTVTSFPTNGNRSSQPRGSWLVKVAPDNTTRLVDWATIATPALGIPTRCEYPFTVGGTAPATGPDSRAPIFGCGNQRPAFNSPVAISEDGAKLVVFSYANNAQGAAFLITLDATTLVPLHASDTRGHLFYGCGVRLDNDFEGDSGTLCSTITANGTTNFGFDPDFNGPVRFRGEDLMDSAPTIAPNGDTSIGSYDGGFQGGGGYDARGGGVLFDASGAFKVSNEIFWWEVTPSVIKRNDGTFSYLQDRQQFTLGNLAVAQLSSSEAVQTLGSHPPDDFGNAFQDAHIVFGSGGDHYGLSSDGHVYKFNAAGKLVDAVALNGDDGNPRAMFTLSAYWARDLKGRIYVHQAGDVWVIDSSPHTNPLPQLQALSPKLATSKAAKSASLGSAALVAPPSE